MKNAAMLSIGAYVPPYELSNFDLEKMVETSDEWIVKRTGIHTRHIAKNETAGDMAAKAADLAISRSGISKEEIDAIICATITPDFFCMPSTACITAEKLGLNKGITAFDISAACSGFIYLLEIGSALIKSGAKKNVLIIGTEKLSSIVDWKDRATCVLFGDGAGATVLSCMDNKNNEISKPYGIIDIHTASDGNKAELLMTPTKNSNIKDIADENLGFLHMKGNEVFKIAVQTLSNDVVKILKKNNVKPEEINLFVPHQANLRIIEAVKNRLNFTDNQCVVTVGKYGNTSSASIPIALNEAYENGRLKNGSLILLDAFGGGFTWGSALIRFGL